jgi:hypothetical protein
VPSNSILVFQPNDYFNMWGNKEEFKVLKNIESLPQLDTIQKVVKSLDSLLQAQLSKTMKGTDLLISFHQNTNESLAALYILEIKKIQQHKVFGDIISLLTDSLKFELTERVYQDYTITEFKKQQLQLAYIFHKNFIIASFSPFLVEDAIRMIANDKSNPFVSNKGNMAELNQVTGAGRVYLNTDLLHKLARIFAHPVNTDTSPLKWLTHLMYLDLTISDDKIDLAGFSVNDTSQINYLSSFDGVRGIGFDMKNVIPASAAYVVHHSFDNAEKWHRGFKNYWRKHDPSQLTRIGEIENKYDLNIKDLYKIMSSEIGLFLIESKTSQDAEKILCIQHMNQDMTAKIFNDLSHASNHNSTWYHESYGGRSISKIEIDEIPSRIFGAMYEGFPVSYYFIDRDFVFVGSSQRALEIVIDAINNENTWRKSVKTNDFLETTNDDANFSIYIKSSGLFSMLGSKLNSYWYQYLEDNKNILKQIEYGAIQFTNVDNNYYTNISLQHPGELIENVKVSSFELVRELSFNKPLVTKAIGVRNHNDQSLEMMMQDEDNTLHLVSSKNETTLSIPLDDKLVGKVHQLDYYKNGKLQYLFAVPHSIHLIDRTGTYIPGYPIAYKSKEKITHLSLIDYDGSRKYRILVGDEKGDFYMHDKAGKRLKGWNPRSLKGLPVSRGKHLRIRKTDMLLFLLDNGVFYALNRKGEVKKNFPLDLKSAFSNDFLIDKGNSLSSTSISCLSDLGEIITFNLEGTITNRQQLVREDDEESFTMIPSKSNRNFLIAKKKRNEVTLYDQELNELFEIEKPSESLQFQYYNFGEDNQMIVVIDLENNNGFLYSKEGELLHTAPLLTGQKLAILYQESKNSYQIFATYNNQFQTFNLMR